MDSKITKKRLGDFMSYEWVLMIALVVAIILFWELIYTVSAVKLTTGQNFYYYYDQNVDYKNYNALYETLNDGKTFSFDVKKITVEEIIKGNDDVLTTRLSAQEGDAIITDFSSSATEGEYPSNRANFIVDNYSIYTFEDEEGGIIYDAKNYLKSFLLEGKTDPLDFESLDREKIARNFNERAKNRVYKNSIEANEISVSDEYQRIKKLCSETAFLEKVVKYDDTLPENESLFYRYTRFEQTVKTAKDQKSIEWEKSQYEKNKECRYALKTSKLVGGEDKKVNSTYFNINGSSEFVVIELFNFKKYQEDLQFESISFINRIIREFSNIEEKI